MKKKKIIKNQRQPITCISTILIQITHTLIIIHSYKLLNDILIARKEEKRKEKK